MNNYEEPGKRLHSHNWSQEYKDNYDAIFGKKETWLERRERLSKCPSYPNDCYCTGECKGVKKISCLDAAYEREAILQGLVKDPIFEENQIFLANMIKENKEKHDNCID